MSDIKKDLQEIYDDIAGEFASSRVFPWDELQVFIPYIKSDFKVLDLGCGNGRLITVLNTTNTKYDYTGVDFSAKLIAHAQQAWPDKRFIVSDINQVDFPAQSFDMVFMIATFHHLDKADERLELLRKINNWLRPGGYLAMTNWNLWQAKYLKDYGHKFWQKRSLRDFFVSWQRYSANRKKYWRYYHSFGQRELEILLKKSGFSLQPRGVYRTKWNVNCLVTKSLD